MEDDYNGSDKVDITIAKPDLCYRYTSVRVENITKHVSPAVMQVRLYYC